MSEYKKLEAGDVKVLTGQGCKATDWDQVKVAEGFDPLRVINVQFLGPVEIGALSGNIKGPDGLEKECGILNAVIANSTIGNNCRIANIGVHIANYNIGDNVCIEDVGVMNTTPGAVFGNGVEVDVLNEGGGREVTLFNELSSQFAYMLCVHRYRPKLIEKLKKIVADYVEKVRSDRGTVSSGACIRLTKELIDVCVGSFALVEGADSLENGTILSTKDAPTLVGTGVVAENFIIAEDSKVTDGVSLSSTFIGQGCRIGRKYSSEHSLFFANCEAFNGESCAIFAGPYTVTHHRSSLLIAGLFSFYNAGSGTNQSNHMYKLGPVHEGKLERGTKTGSFSYMMWPCRTGPFSVVMGKHSANFDTENYPFSHIEAGPAGKASMIPGLNLTTVGTVRDGAKWPKRDRRDKSARRDVISFDVFSPYLVGKMIKARAELNKLQKATDKSIEEVSVGGALVKRPILRTGQKYYRTGIDMYLSEKIFERAEKAMQRGLEGIQAAFSGDKDAVYSETWVDIGGQLMPQGRLNKLQETIEAGGIEDMNGFLDAVKQIELFYEIDQWAWVKKTYRDLCGVDLDNATKEDVLQIADLFFKVKRKFYRLILNDAEKEFDDLSSLGFGQDGSCDDREKDFCQVRGEYDGNKFIKEMKANLFDLEIRVSSLKEKLD